MVFAPLYFILTFTGLTEPLFALFISVGLLLFLKKKYLWGSVILSFLPFVRSEGLIIIGVFAFFLLLKKQWKYLPALMFGHLFYAVAGYFLYQDFLWVFTKIPYANLGSPYGSRELFHFVEQLLFITGGPMYILFWVGAGAIIWKLLLRKTNLKLSVLVFAGFFSFFVAHTLFWYFGIFNSMGLKRVLISVMPFLAIISLVGFNTLSEFIKNKKYRRTFQILCLASILIFPFTPNHYAVNWQNELSLTKKQKLAHLTIDPVYNIGQGNSRLVFTDAYLSVVFNVDHFDFEKRLPLSRHLSDLRKGDVIIWDNWFAVSEIGITKKRLNNHPDLVHIIDLKGMNHDNEIMYSVYYFE